MAFGWNSPWVAHWLVSLPPLIDPGLVIVRCSCWSAPVTPSSFRSCMPNAHCFALFVFAAQINAGIVKGLVEACGKACPGVSNHCCNQAMHESYHMGHVFGVEGKCKAQWSHPNSCCCHLAGSSSCTSSTSSFDSLVVTMFWRPCLALQQPTHHWAGLCAEEAVSLCCRLAAAGWYMHKHVQKSTNLMN